MIHVAELRCRPVFRERVVPVGGARCGGSVPTIGCHSVIDNPECVSRVTPPTTTIANTSRQHTASHAISGRFDTRQPTGLRRHGAGGAG